MKTVFGTLALAAAVFSMAANIYRGKWKRFALDIWVCFVHLPLWIILGLAVIRGIFPDLIYSYFPGIWLSVGLSLWLVPHGILAAKAFHRKDWFDVLCAVSVILAIIFFCLFIHLGDMTKNAF